MKFELHPLPYDKDALEPHISARTLEFHYNKHHQGYLDKLQNKIGDTPDADKPLEEIIKITEDPKVFNLGAQVWNHNFYWHSLSPDGGQPSKRLVKLLNDNFGSVEAFKKQLASAANGQFGSGWAWLIGRDNGKLEIEATANADNPVKSGDVPLLTIDVWEHAYYLDYQHERPRYVDAFLEELINWRFIDQNLEALTKSKAA